MKIQFPPSKTRRLQSGIAAAAIFALSGPAAGAADGSSEPEIDPASGMIIDENWQTVRVMCSVCHSPKLYTNYGATRETWASLIDWMQEKQGLWPLPLEIEDQILTYLAKNYPPGEVSRRRNLAASMRPPNPYESTVKAEFEAKRKRGEIIVPELEKD
jgi:hypothetical protein